MSEKRDGKKLAYAWMRGFSVGASCGPIDPRDELLPIHEREAFNDGLKDGQQRRVIARAICEAKYNIAFTAIKAL